MKEDKKIPQFINIANSIQNKIRYGEYKANDVIPSEHELSKIYSTSRVTIRHALNLLRKDNYIYTEKGRGSFVSPVRLLEKIENGGFTYQYRKLGYNVYSKILDFYKIDAIPKQFLLHIDFSGNPEFENGAYFLKRVRYADKQPVSIQETVIPFMTFPGLFDIDFSNHSIYEEFEKRFEIKPHVSDMLLFPTIANDYEVGLLKITKFDPLLESWAIVYQKNGQIMESTHSLDINKFGFRVRYLYESLHRIS